MNLAFSPYNIGNFCPHPLIDEVVYFSEGFFPWPTNQMYLTLKLHPRATLPADGADGAEGAATKALEDRGWSCEVGCLVNDCGDNS